MLTVIRYVQIKNCNSVSSSHNYNVFLSDNDMGDIIMTA